MTTSTITAIHEAGHAVAAEMRGSVVTGVTVSGADGHTSFTGPQWDQQFITYGGVWAEARHLWADGQPETLDAEDSEGIAFRDYVSSVLLTQPSDAQNLGEVSPVLETIWHAELLRQWDNIVTRSEV